MKLYRKCGRLFLGHLSLISISLQLLVVVADGRPEYAVKHGVVNCTACHASPSGGGIRNTYGKMYGAHGFKPSVHHERPYYQLDVRAMAFSSQEVRNGRNGLGLMEVLGSVQIPVLEDNDETTTFVATYNYGAFVTGLRDTYVNWQKPTGIKNIVVGVFTPPFGLLTDEHRTYTRFQSRTTWNNFDMGVMLSGDLSTNLHWDFAMVNGFQNAAGEGGGNFSQGDTYGLFANIRTIPFSKALMFGTSYSYHQRRNDAPSPYAMSLYTGLGLESWTGGRLRGSVLLEYVRSHYWNNTFTNPEYDRQFALGLDGNYITQLMDQIAEGYYAQVLLDVSRNFSLQYKWDKLVPSTNFRGDHFDRFGVGFRYRTSANLHLWARGEWVEVGRPDVPKTAPIAADAYWLLAHFWF